MVDFIKELSEAKNESVRIATTMLRLMKLYEEAPKSKKEFTQLAQGIIDKSKNILELLNKVEV